MELSADKDAYLAGPQLTTAYAFEVLRSLYQRYEIESWRSQDED
jgi:hypothetical protein